MDCLTLGYTRQYCSPSPSMASDPPNGSSVCGLPAAELLCKPLLHGDHVISLNCHCVATEATPSMPHMRSRRGLPGPRSLRATRCMACILAVSVAVRGSDQLKCSSMAFLTGPGYYSEHHLGLWPKARSIQVHRASGPLFSLCQPKHNIVATLSCSISEVEAEQAAASELESGSRRLFVF